MSDPFDSGLRKPDITRGASHFQITPDDGADLPVRPRAIFVNAGGTVALQDKSGTVVSYDVPAGAVLSIRPLRVLATGTTAQLVAWY